MILTREEFPRYAHFFDEAENDLKEDNTEKIFRTNLKIRKTLGGTLYVWGCYCFHSIRENSRCIHKTQLSKNKFIYVMEKLLKHEIVWLDCHPGGPHLAGPLLLCGDTLLKLEKYLSKYDDNIINKFIDFRDCPQYLQDRIIHYHLKNNIIFMPHNIHPALNETFPVAISIEEALETPTSNFIMSFYKDQLYTFSTSPQTLEEYLIIMLYARWSGKAQEFDMIDLVIDKNLCMDIMKFYLDTGIEDIYPLRFMEELIDWYVIPLDADFSKNIANATREKITSMSANSFLPRDLFTLIMKFTFLSPNLI